MKQIIIKFRNGKQIVTTLSNKEAFKTDVQITLTIGCIFVGLVVLGFSFIGRLLW
jgi:hypothetical protein